MCVCSLFWGFILVWFFVCWIVCFFVGWLVGWLVVFQFCKAGNSRWGLDLTLCHPLSVNRVSLRLLDLDLLIEQITRVEMH